MALGDSDEQSLDKDEVSDCNFEDAPSIDEYCDIIEELHATIKKQSKEIKKIKKDNSRKISLLVTMLLN